MTQTITDADRQKIADHLAGITLTHGLGDNVMYHCSAVAINLALGLIDELDDHRPDCASLVVWTWMIRVQDTIPLDILNGAAWRAVVPYVAGSSDDTREGERRDRIIDWMWEALGYEWRQWVPEAAHGDWQRMLTERTHSAISAVEGSALNSGAGDAAHSASSALGDGDGGIPRISAAISAVTRAAAAYADATASTGGGSDATFATVWEHLNPAGLLAELVR